MKGSFKIIGCRAGSPADGIPASGYMIKGISGNVLIDCGPGVVLSLTHDEIENLAGVIITHQHSDHCLDLVALSYNLLFPVPKKKIPLYGPPSLLKTLDTLDALFGIPTLSVLKAPIAMAFDYVPVKPGDSFKAAGYNFGTLKMKHPVETMAICSRDFMLVYTADGAYTASLKSFCIGNNYLVSEATYKDHGKNDLDQHGHMTAEICGTLAESAGIKQLIITHLSDYNDSAGTIKTAGKYFSGDIQMAYPGLEIMFNE